MPTDPGDTPMNAIPTEYRGVRLRSRFEAQAAYMFDAFGWTWKYEPRSYMLPGGVTYTPDFYLPEQRAVVECRGYDSERGDAQIEAFGTVVQEGQAAPDGNSILRYMTLKADDVRVYRIRHTEYAEAGLVVWCAVCAGWRLLSLGRDEQCPTCFSHGSSVQKAYALTVSEGKILINGTASAHWDGMLFGNCCTAETV